VSGADANAGDSGGGMRIAAAVLFALPLLMFLMAGGLIAISERESGLAVESRLASAARVVAGQARTLLDSRLEALRVADAELGADPGQFSSRIVRGGEGADVDDAFVAVFSADGTFLPPRGFAMQMAPIGANADFRSLAAGAPWVVTPMILTGPTGGRVFALGRRLERDGRFAGVAVTYVSADTLVDAWVAVDLGKDSTVALVRDDGWLVTRFPVPEEPINLANNVLFTEQLPAASQGAYWTTSPIDDIRRRVAYQRIEGLPLVVTASMSAEVIQTSFWRRVRTTALVAAPVSIALIAACVGMYLLLRRERAARLALQSALAENRMLFQEVHHRVKNNLQTVAAMIRLQPGPAEPKDELYNRIAAMTAVHQHMYESNQFETLQVADYIEKLVRRLHEGYGGRITLETRLDPLELPAERALTLGLLVNEVVSNAFKHAFPDGRSGAVAVELTVKDGHALLVIRDDGVGSADAERVGMGSRLIKGFADRLGGEPHVWRKQGTEFELRFPVKLD
jgi:two-component system, sensor histidine kinase PdtaS